MSVYIDIPLTYLFLNNVYLRYIFLAPAVTVGETEGAMDSASVFFSSFFAYNFMRKKARIKIFGMWVTSRWIMDR